MCILFLELFTLDWLNNSIQKVMRTKISRFPPTVGPFSSVKLVNIFKNRDGGGVENEGRNAWVGWNGNFVGRTSNLNYSF
jgi:hypothetical protein